ncbi:MAG: metallophosphoesterase [Gammaproteobacteria bacterium]
MHDLDQIVTREHVIHLEDTKLDGLNIGVVGDLHFSGQDDLQKIEVISEQMEGKEIDLIFLVGDYIGDRSLLETVSRVALTEKLAALSSIAPTFAVLGNHENWDDHTAWTDAIEGSSIYLVEGKVLQTTVRGELICVRGLGDLYSDYWSDVEIPKQCTGSTITLTHDPNGLLQKIPNSVETLSFAGHTHCGQVWLPFLTRFLVPSNAPTELHCGKFTLGSSGVVTGGVGTSILPVRLGRGMEPAWEYVAISMPDGP